MKANEQPSFNFKRICALCIAVYVALVILLYFLMGHQLHFRESRGDIALPIAEAGTVVWNGPVGAFEIDQFGKGTEAIAKAVAETSAYTVTGGGDSIAALEKYGYASQVDYISTAGRSSKCWKAKPCRTWPLLRRVRHREPVILP